MLWTPPANSGGRFYIAGADTVSQAFIALDDAASLPAGRDNSKTEEPLAKLSVPLGTAMAPRVIAPRITAAQNFAATSLIIPMDTDTSGNHASYNQNLGMWKAYGLIYQLLQNNIPVYWTIKDNKSFNDIDFT